MSLPTGITIVDACPNFNSGACPNLDRTCECTRVQPTEDLECPVCLDVKVCIRPWQCKHVICGRCFQGPKAPPLKRTCPNNEPLGCLTFCVDCANDELQQWTLFEEHLQQKKNLQSKCCLCRSQ